MGDPNPNRIQCRRGGGLVGTETALFLAQKGRKVNITRETMQTANVRIRQETSKTILFVSHSTDEVALLGEQIFVMTTRPGKVRIRTVIEVDLPKPRNKEDHKMVELQSKLRQLLCEDLDDCID